MKSHSTSWDSAIVRAHVAKTTASVLFNGVVIREGLSVTGGSVTLDRTASALGRCDITLAEPLLVPTVTGGTLSPYGYELSIRSGIAYPDGTSELMPLGVFPIQRSEVDGMTFLTQLTTIDRTQRVRDARLTDDYLVAASTNYATAINTLLQTQVPGLPTLSAPTITFSTPSAGIVLPAGSDPWDHAQDMAASCGCKLFFSGLGTPTLQPEPTFGQAPVWTVADGALGAMVSASLSLDRSTAYNAVVATGSAATSAQVFRAIAIDDDPASPTYWYGPFGQKPKFYASPLITSTDQAQSAADALLQSTRGVARSLVFSALPNSALDPGDPVLIKRAALNLNEVHLIDAMRIDLSVGVMACASRARAEQ